MKWINSRSNKSSHSSDYRPYKRFKSIQRKEEGYYLSTYPSEEQDTQSTGRQEAYALYVNDHNNLTDQNTEVEVGNNLSSSSQSLYFIHLIFSL